MFYPWYGVLFPVLPLPYMARLERIHQDKILLVPTLTNFYHLYKLYHLPIIVSNFDARNFKIFVDGHRHIHTTVSREVELIHPAAVRVGQISYPWCMGENHHRVRLARYTHPTSVIRRIWSRRRSGALKISGSIRNFDWEEFLKIFISIRTKIMVRNHIKKWSEVSN